MIQYVWEAAAASGALDEWVVATEDEEIAEVARGFGAEVVMTPEGFASGSDRVAWVARHRPADIVVNLQGDEPLLPPGAIRRLVEALESDPSWGMATLVVRKNRDEALADPNVVKVVATPEGRAIYFSRQPLSVDSGGGYLKHVGIYAYRSDVLCHLSTLPPSPLEQVERLEQLRALENGIGIRLVEMDRDTIGVDTPADLIRAEEWLSRESGESPSKSQ